MFIIIPSTILYIFNKLLVVAVVIITIINKPIPISSNILLLWGKKILNFI